KAPFDLWLPKQVGRTKVIAAMVFAFPKRENCQLISGLITPTETKRVGGFFYAQLQIDWFKQRNSRSRALLGFQACRQSFQPNQRSLICTCLAMPCCSE